MSVQRLKPGKMNPSLKTLYSRYDEITEAHCKYLLNHLYTHNITEWINPITKKEVQRDSSITISFLSKCYWGEWGDKIVTINGINKKYKIHVSYFIDEWYLYDVRFRPSPNLTPAKKSPKIVPATPATAQVQQTHSNSPAGAPSPRKKSPNIVQVTAVTQAQRPKRNSPPGAATNKPRSQSPSSPSQPNLNNSSKSSVKLDFSPKSVNSIIKNTGSVSVNADKLTENDCIELVKEIRRIKRGKTAEEIKLLKIVNPITKKEIGLKSPIFKSFLAKCYIKFDKNENLQKSIKKIINVQSLDILKEKHLAEEKEKEEKRLALEKKNEEKRLAKEKEKEERRKKIPIIDHLSAYQIRLNPFVRMYK